MKKPNKNNVVFEIVSDADFLGFGSKMVPKWSRRGAKIDTKTASGHKSGISLPYTKINGFRRKTGAQGLHLGSRSAPESMTKRRLMSIPVFYQLFIYLGRLREPKSDPGGSFLRPFFDTEKRVRKTCPRGATGSHGEPSAGSDRPP